MEARLDLWKKCFSHTMKRFFSIITYQVHYVLLVLLCSCSSVDVEVEYAENIDFSSYDTYAWDSSFSDAEESSFGHKVIFPDLDRRIKKFIDFELSRKGFSKASSEEATLLISLQERVEEEKEHSGKPSLEYVEKDYVSPTGNLEVDVAGVGVRGAPLDSVQRGMLILKMKEAKSNRIIWTGSAESLVNDYASSRHEIKRFVGHLLAEFPPNTQ